MSLLQVDVLSMQLFLHNGAVRLVRLVLQVYKDD